MPQTQLMRRTLLMFASCSGSAATTLRPAAGFRLKTPLSRIRRLPLACAIIHQSVSKRSVKEPGPPLHPSRSSGSTRLEGMAPAASPFAGRESYWGQCHDSSVRRGITCSVRRINGVWAEPGSRCSNHAGCCPIAQPKGSPGFVNDIIKILTSPLYLPALGLSRESRWARQRRRGRPISTTVRYLTHSVGVFKRVLTLA